MTENNNTVELDKESWFIIGTAAVSTAAGFYDGKIAESVLVLCATSTLISAATWYLEDRVPSIFEIMEQNYQPDL